MQKEHIILFLGLIIVSLVMLISFREATEKWIRIICYITIVVSILCGIIEYMNTILPL